jgi:hypothetical protein
MKEEIETILIQKSNIQINHLHLVKSNLPIKSTQSLVICYQKGKVHKIYNYAKIQWLELKHLTKIHLKDLYHLLNYIKCQNHLKNYTIKYTHISLINQFIYKTNLNKKWWSKEQKNLSTQLNVLLQFKFIQKLI